MDRVMRQVPGYWLGRAGHSSVGYSLCPNPHPIVVLHGGGGCHLPFFRLGQLSTPRIPHIFLCVENRRHGGLLRSSDLAGI